MSRKVVLRRIKMIALTRLEHAAIWARTIRGS